jgi:hypothetical protein
VGDFNAVQPSAEHRPAGRSTRSAQARKRVILDREIELYILSQFAADSFGARRRFRAGVGAGPARLIPGERPDSRPAPRTPSAG